MLQHICRAVVLVAVSFAWNESTWAADKEEPVDLEITTKLGVKAKVKVQKTSTDKRVEGLDSTTDSAVEKVPKLRLALEQGNGVYLTIPLRLIKGVTATDKGHTVKLADDSVQIGKVLTVSTGDDGKSYDLASAKEITNPAPGEVKKADPKRQRLTLSITEPMVKSYEVFRPKVSTGRFYGEAFAMTLDGEKFEANLSDFDKVGMVKKGRIWQITVKAPDAPEKTGPFSMPNGWWYFGCETTNGCALVLRGLRSKDEGPDNPGFTLEKSLSRSSIGK